MASLSSIFILLKNKLLLGFNLFLPVLLSFESVGAESAFTDGRGVNPAQGLRLGRTN